MKLQTIRSVLSTFAIGFALVCSIAYAEDQTLTLFPLNIEVFDLTPIQQTVEKTFQVEPDTEIDILVLSASLTLDIALVDPSNNVYPHGSDTQFITASYTYPERSQATSGLTYLFHLKSAPPGSWKCRVRETVPLTGPRGVVFQLSSSSLIRTGLLGAGDTYVAGVPITLSVVTTNGEAVLKAPEIHSVSGSIVKVDDSTFSPLPVTFLDNGVGLDAQTNDGLFTVSPVLGPGEYSLFGVANGVTSASQTFTRNFSGRFKVIMDSASYAGTFREQVSDLNGNGLPDTLEIIPSFNVNAAGDYFAGVTLQGPNGKEINANGKATLSPGPGREISVPFDITILRLLRSDGPWQIKLLQLEKLDDPGSGYLEHRENAGNTSDYRLKDFERKGLFLVGTPTVSPIDDDSNGLYDRLQVSIPIEVATTEQYHWILSLYDSADILGDSTQKIEEVSGSSFLEATEAPAVLTVLFDGRKIGRHGVNGPYMIGSLGVQGSHGLLQEGDIVITPAFTFAQFEGVGSAPSPTVSLTKDSLTFGTENIGVTFGPYFTILENTGDGSLTMANIATVGDFAQTNTCGNSVAAGQYCLIYVTFTPTAIGARAGTLTLTDNASNSPQVIPLSGTGIAAGASLSASSLTFGSQNVGVTSPPQGITLSNTGNASLTITNIATVGDFAQSNTCDNHLNAGQNCSISVSFTPTATGPRTGSITLTDNASNSPQVIALSGSGIGIAPAVSLSASSLTFTRQNVGSTSPPQSLTLSNPGTAPLLITSIVARGDFTQSNNCGSSLAAGASCILNVIFTPTDTGARSGGIIFTDNASNSPQQVALKGVGIASAPISPIFEGWYKNPNGSFTLSFGYQNLNDGTVQILVGSNNFFTPRPQDRGQTTLFQAGRQARSFNVVVPSNFTGNLVWTLTFAGSQKTTTGSLNPALHIRP